MLKIMTMWLKLLMNVTFLMMPFLRVILLSQFPTHLILCYAICDYEYIVQAQEIEASHRSQLFLVSWCPDSARIKKKMIFVASAE